MQKHYVVMFYGEIQNSKDLSQVKKLLAKILGKDEADINSSNSRSILPESIHN